MKTGNNSSPRVAASDTGSPKQAARLIIRATRANRTVDMQLVKQIGGARPMEFDFYVTPTNIISG